MIFTACDNTEPDSFNPKYAKTNLIGYCGDGEIVSCGAGTASTIGGATRIQAAMYEGSTHILAIRVYLGAEATNAKVFITKNPNGTEHLYEQQFNAVANAWNVVTLNTPFALDSISGDFYMGYIAETTGNILAFENGEFQTITIIGSDGNPTEVCSDIYFDSTEGDIWSWFTNLANYEYRGKVAVQAIVSGGNYSAEAQNDIQITNVRVNEKLPTNASNIISFDIVNRGVNTVGQLKINYSFAGTSNEIVVNDIELWNGMHHSVLISDIKAPSEVGSQTLSITIKNPYNTNDENVNNNTYSINQEICKGFNRILLIEKFSGQSCSKCPNGSVIIDNVRSQFPGQTVEVIHHEGFGADAFTIDCSKEYTCFYNRPKFSPAFMLDRNEEYSHDKGYVVSNVADGTTSLAVFTADLVQKALSAVAPLSIEISHTYNSATRHLAVTIKGETIGAMPNARVNVWLTQSNIEAWQLSGGDNYKHNHAIRANITETWGEPIVITPDNYYEMTFNYTIPEQVGDFPVVDSDVEIVAFVADYDANNLLNCRVHNATAVALQK